MVLVKWMITCCSRPLAALEIQFLVNPSCRKMKFLTGKLLSVIIHPSRSKLARVQARGVALSVLTAEHPSQTPSTPLQLNYICSLILSVTVTQLCIWPLGFLHFFFHLSSTTNSERDAGTLLRSLNVMSEAASDIPSAPLFCKQTQQPCSSNATLHARCSVSQLVPLMSNGHFSEQHFTDLILPGNCRKPHSLWLLQDDEQIAARMWSVQQR